jgi:3-phenylpropionate/trans-cinnamate dioxygenase ferredoxin subunit
MSQSARAQAPDDFEPVARVEQVTEGSLLAVKRRDGSRICLGNDRGQIVALSDTCTHQEFAMSDGTLLPDGTIECAWHGATFDCRSGKVRRGPATDPLPRFQVRIAEGVVYVGGRVR